MNANPLRSVAVASSAACADHCRWRRAACLFAATLALDNSRPAAAQSPTLDAGFNPGADWYVYSLAVQADGKILVGGSFRTLGGQERNRIGRLNPDGTLDVSFNQGTSRFDGAVESLAVQVDGRILVGGNFGSLGGQFRDGIGRLNPDGTLDVGFNPRVNGEGGYVVVHSLTVQADGRILVGGWFDSLGGQPRANIGRLNLDGTLDASFNPGAGGGDTPRVYTLAVQGDGKILVGGFFTTLDGQERNNIGRLNPDGTLDEGFNPGASGPVFSLAVQADGRILVGGRSIMVDQDERRSIGRLHADGSVDYDFYPRVDMDVMSLAVQADGKILVGGFFTTLDWQERNNIGRLNPDGTLDASFNPGAGGGAVASLAVQADGKILVGGGFTTLDGQPREYLGRLNNTEPAIQALYYDGTTITWVRGGASPEVWRTTFDYSPDLVVWTSLGEGNRVPGGWERPEVSVPPDAIIRARGQTVGGGSSGLVESYGGGGQADTIGGAA